jgi:isopenicillin N synthase-like dioxygenase
VPRLPVIDVSALVAADASGSDRADVARQLDAACQAVGFFYIVGHGVDPSLLARLEAVSRRFFALPETVKAEIAMARAGRAWRGWFPLGGELTSGVADLKEGVYFGAELDGTHPLPLHGRNLFPNEPAELREAVLTYLDVMTRLGQSVLGGLALGLGLERTWFVDNLTSDPLILFRIFRYPPTEYTADDWGVAEHTDYGLLTILAQDDRGGLEVRTPQGWIDAEAIPNSFVCNLGDMLERLTGGRYRSTPHRVRNASDSDRLSFPFFLDPSWDAVVERLPVVERPPDGRAADRWDHANVHGFTGTYGEYILGKVAKVFPDLAEHEQ